MAKVAPYRPSRRDPWDARKARHLLNRTGFGGTPEEVEALVKQGFEEAVHHIVHYETVQDSLGRPAWLDQPLQVPGLEDLPPFRAGGRRAGEGAPPGTNPQAQGAVTNVPRPGGPAAPEEPQRDRVRRVRQAVQRGVYLRIEELRSWWLDRMVHTPRPLEEKMTLFWHGHFATQAIKVRAPQLIHAHNELLRRSATGSFRELVLGVARDPAMLVYLDNNQNRKEHPNENFARELMELFTLGIGHYSEDDVKEAARAFTGWALGLEGERGMRPAGPLMLIRIAIGAARPTFTVRTAWHDDGEKRFLGHRGDFDGAQIVRIILEQPTCPEFICGKLARFFLGEDRQQPELVAGLAEVMRRSDYQMKPVLETLFRSHAFYADDVIGSQIKSPVQLVAGAVKQLRAEVKPPLLLNLALRQMGQLPLDPPNVAGWDGGKHWINTSTLLARYNFSLFLLQGQPLGNGPAGGPGAGLLRALMADGIKTQVDVMSLCTADDLKSPGRLVDRLADRLLAVPLAPGQRAELMSAAEKPDGVADDEARLKHLVHLIMSTPNYQVC